jgi:hypothetical protein
MGYWLWAVIVVVAADEEGKMGSRCLFMLVG